MSVKHTFKLLWLFFAVSVLSACGSESNADSANVTPPLAVSNVSQADIAINQTIVEKIELNALLKGNDTDKLIQLTQITFTDAKLASCVESTAKKNRWKTVGEMVKLDCADKGINSIGGIQNLTSLKSLDLQLNAITMLTPMAKLTALSHLNLAGNGLVNIEPLANLVALTHLELGVAQRLGSAVNSIRNISALADLTSLILLDLGGNQISNISPLQNLPALTEVHLFGNQIRDIQVLLNIPNATVINLYDNDNITCAELNELESVVMEGRVDRPSDCIFTLDILISDISFPDQNLKSCVLDTASSEGWITLNEMTSLDCDEQYITNLTGLESLKALNQLDLRSNQIISISPLFNLTATANINLSVNEQIACLRLDALEAVLGSGVVNRPANCAPVTLITDLDFVDPILEACVRYTARLYQWTIIDEMVSLRCGINQSKAKIKDLRGIDQLTALENIHLGGRLYDSNDINDISALFYLNKTNLIDLSANKAIACHDLDVLEASLNVTVNRPKHCRY
jgi:internalin A